MKKNLLVLAASCLILSLSAQQLTYEVSISDLPYLSLEESTLLPLLEDWDDEEFELELGMNFPIQTQNFGSFIFDSNGNSATPEYEFIFALFAADFASRGETSTIGYTLSGSAPNRTFTLEFSNAGFYGEDERESEANFQVFLMENGCFGAHIGSPFNVLDPALCYGGDAGPSIGYLNLSTFNGQFLSGSPGEPVLVDFDGKNLPTFSGTPEPGTRYELCPVNTVKTSLAQDAGNFIVYPNPSSGMVTFKSTGVKSNSTVEFFDLTGRIVSSSALSNGNTLIDLTHLQTGVYTYFVKSDKEIKSGKISITK